MEGTQKLPHVNACFTCLNTTHVDSTLLDTKWIKLIEYCTGIMVDLNYRMWNICTQCSEQIQGYAQFKQKCEKSNTFWKSILSGNLICNIGQHDAGSADNVKNKDESDLIKTKEPLLNFDTVNNIEGKEDTCYDDFDGNTFDNTQDEFMSPECKPEIIGPLNDDVRDELKKKSLTQIDETTFKCDSLKVSRKNYVEKCKKSKTNKLELSSLPLSQELHYCGLCDMTSSSLDAVNKHVLEEHSSKNDLNCKMCDDVGWDVAQMEVHRNSENSSRVASPAPVALLVPNGVPSTAVNMEIDAQPNISALRAVRQPHKSQTTSNSSRKGRRRPLKDSKTKKGVFYGSEEDDSGDDESEMMPVSVPRVARPYLLDGNEKCAEAEDELSWPPVERVQPEAEAPAEAPAPTEAPVSSLQTEMPIDKFDFRWTAFPNPQIPPVLRRETFVGLEGPTAQYAGPYEAFVAIWDRPIMELIARETNKYASQLCEVMLVSGIGPNSRITKWVDTTVDELYTYFAILLATGVVTKTRLEEYWSSSKDIFQTPEFSSAMTYDRYCLLSKCLHFNDNDLCTAERISNSEAKLHKLLPIVQHLNDKFASLYMLGRNIALDESLTQWTGYLNIKQYIPNKAATVGIKTYEVCDSATGYLWRFEMEARQFTTDPQDANPLSGKISALVLRLLNGLEHKGHTVWMDNFYNSPALARELKILGFDCVGTLRTNRQFVPAEITNLQAKDMQVGQIYGCTSGDVDLIVWRCKKLIALISTYHGLTTVESADTIKPALIADYNICMGGVDKKDQMLAMYPIERKRTRVWYKKLFRRLLNASTLNSYVMLKTKQQLTHRNFRKTLVLELLKRHTIYKKRTRDLAITSNRHVPQLFGRPDDKSNGTSRRLRRKCVVCAKRTTSFCEGCDGKALCVPRCFSRYHK